MLSADNLLSVLYNDAVVCGPYLLSHDVMQHFCF